MTQALDHDVAGDWGVHQQATRLLESGAIQEGVRLLGDVADRTTDGLLRSMCTYNLGEVLESLGQIDEAYQTYYPLAHASPTTRNEFDHRARVRVMDIFSTRALRVTPPDFPPKVQIEITNRCNLRCVMCTRHQMQRPLGDLGWETFQRIADECSAETGCVLSLYFLGESLLHANFDQMVRYLERVRHRSPVPLVYGLQTNGTLLTRRRARVLLASGLREIGISLDGLSGDLERVRPGASYEVIERNVLGLLETAGEMGIDDLLVDICKLCDDPHSAEARRFVEHWQGKVRNVHLMHITKVEGLSYLGADGSIQPVGPKQHSPPRAYCGEGSRLLIHWNGDFAFCCSDIDGELKLGNIRDRSIREAWNSSEMEDLRGRMLAADYAGLSACLRCPHSYS
ncbi:MAG: radical SAM protein [bacterium]|nr:radical SAM protein [bacterium]